MGTKFSLKDPNPGAWFYFDEANPTSGRICLRVLNAAKRQEIAKATEKRRVEYKQGTRFEFMEVDEDKRTSLMWDYCIIGWENLTEDDGTPIECTTENKIKLMMENIGFASFVGSCLSRINDSIDMIKDATSKNS